MAQSLAKIAHSGFLESKVDTAARLASDHMRRLAVGA
jgi:hypothetical protein